MEAHSTILKKHCHVEEVFQTAKAEAWIGGEEQEIPDVDPRHDSDSDNDSSVAEVDEKASSTRQVG